MKRLIGKLLGAKHRRQLRHATRRSMIYSRQFIGFFRLAAFWIDCPECRFVIFSQGRTGSALLAELLRSHPAIHVDAEIFNADKFGKTPFPASHLSSRTRIAGLNRKSAYCFRVKHSQLAGDQALKEPQGFLKRLYRDGWKIVYLRRDNIFRVALSTTVAQQRGYYHASDQRATQRPTLVDCDLLWRELESAEIRQRAEQGYLDGLDYMLLRYECDLSDAEQHQETANKVFDHVGLPRAAVRSRLQKTSTSRLSDVIGNYEEVKNLVVASRYAEYWQ